MTQNLPWGLVRPSLQSGIENRPILNGGQKKSEIFYSHVAI